jgi:hypothetical protein
VGFATKGDGKMNDKDLCAWLRENSSGAYRTSATAADRIEELLTTQKDPVAKLQCSDGLSDNRELRKLLWLTHGCISLYGDDGELQCNCGPHKPIDFKRDSVEDIKTKLLKLGR